jgi:hypothetical protein
LLYKLGLLLLQISLLTATSTLAQTRKQDDYLIRVFKPETDEYGFRDKSGKMVIDFNKYPIIFTDTFRSHAIVLKSTKGFVAIDRNERVLYQIFPYDNGPDYPSEGLYRILENGKIGYADLNGKIIITPQFTCAFPFEGGKAKVSNSCTKHMKGEHSYWKSEEWFYINRKGKKL